MEKYHRKSCNDLFIQARKMELQKQLALRYGINQKEKKRKKQIKSVNRQKFK